MQIVSNSCKLLVFKRYAMKRLRRLYSTVNVSESSRDDSSTHQIIHGDEAADVSLQSIITLYSSVLGWNPMKANDIQMHFWLETFCIRAFLLKTGHFLIYLFILTSLFLYLVHVYIVSRIAQKRNNIKCIIFVVLNWLLFICLTLPVTSATVDTEQHLKPSSSQYSQIVCDSNIIDWDIYLYSQHCECHIKWLEEQNNAAGYI